MRIVIGEGSCGIAAGAQKVRSALEALITEPIGSTGCIGMCYLEPIVDVYDENGNRIKDDYGSTIFYDTDGNMYLSADYFETDATLCTVKTAEGELFTTLWSDVAFFIQQVKNYLNGDTVLIRN